MANFNFAPTTSSRFPSFGKPGAPAETPRDIPQLPTPGMPGAPSVPGTPGAPTLPGRPAPTPAPEATPFEATPFEAPTFEAPEWDESRITELTQAAAAPGMRALGRGMRESLPGGYSPQEVQARRAVVEGYGGALSQVMGGARATGRAQYGEQYGREFQAEELGFGAEMEEARAEWQGGQAEAQREWQTGETEAQRDWEEEQREIQREWEEEFGGPGGTGLPGPAERPDPETTGGGRTTDPWAGSGWFSQRATGGRITAPTYEVGERGPELVAYDSGRTELVGQDGPEVRTFPERGEVIPAGKTRAIMSRQGGGPVRSPMQINYNRPPPLSEEEQTAFNRAMQEYRKTYPQDFGAVPENRRPIRESMLIKRQRGGKVVPRAARRRAPTRGPSPLSPEVWMNQPYKVGLLDPMYDLTKHLIGYPRWYVDTLMQRGLQMAMRRGVVGGSGGARTPPTLQTGSGGFEAHSPRHAPVVPTPAPSRQLPGI